MKSIIAGEQYATIYKDTRQLADVTVKMADAVLKGGKPEVEQHQGLRQRRQGRPVATCSSR